eukprot:CAMPEP_0194122264 /NCGR_PEP_ID=MMETSP0150-20130528/49936_1 /TAXON_ID=122233 /ORGANISM="Chaetoceros debilis, Strain MM31A-1" /LENGTH=372 /DNA_ID=CAMNT_0038815027 /DNA_START=33 /DNA_END=1147 /DNA_ORIENTATION=+
MPNKDELKAIFELFEVQGFFIDGVPFGSGHINDTYKVRTNFINDNSSSGQDDGVGVKERLYILQRINHEIFTRPVEVMENIQRVTEHLRKKIISRGGDPERETLTLIPTKDDGEDSKSKGKFHAVVDGNFWRVYDFISDARGYEIGETADTASGSNTNIPREVAASFARFQCDLADLPPPRLHETIPKFGDAGYRFQQLEDALAADAKSRAATCSEEIRFCMERKSDASLLSNLLKDGTMSERIIHYDTKINNILIDDSTGRGLCVIDLDTVMPGIGIFDFGDTVRAASALSSEDERDLCKVGFSMEVFESLVDGYLSTAKDLVTEEEIDQLAFSAKLLCLIIGVRFLTDYLAGDVYFKTDAGREEHNLDRA